MPLLPSKRFLAVTILSGVVVLASAGSAAADLRIANVDGSAVPSVRVTVVTSKPSLRAPRLSENGQAITDLTAENLGAAKNVVLAIDRSRSMHGKSLRDATAAAARFVALKPQSDQIAVVSFASQTVFETQFSGSGSNAEVALRSITDDRVYGTTLYDAIVQSAAALTKAGLPGRVIVLVTDGQETTSHASLSQAVKAARKAHALVYAIAIESPVFSPAPLKQLARQTGGTYYGVRSSSALAAIYENISLELRRTWQLRYLTAARPGDRLRLAVSDASLGRASTVVRLPGRGAQAPLAGLSLPMIALALLLVLALCAALARPVLDSVRGLRFGQGRGDY